MVEEAEQADGGVQPSPPERPLSGTGSAGSAVSGKGKGDAAAGSAGAGLPSKGKGQTGAGSDGSAESGKGKGQGAGSAGSAKPQDVALATLAMKGIELPTKGQNKGQGQASKPPAPVTLDSVTPMLIRTPPDRPTASCLLSRPCPEATAAAAPPPVGTDPSSLPRSARQDANADTLSVRLDEIMERLQVLEQDNVEILNLLRAHPRLSWT